MKASFCRSTFLIFSIAFCENIYSQHNNFALGLTIEPFIYHNYNQLDWNNRPESFPVSPLNFNATAFGIASETRISDLFSLKIDALYSKENQQHTLLLSKIFDPNSNTYEYLYGTNVTTEFKLFSLPIEFSLNKEIGYNSDLFIQFFVGPKISYVNSYVYSYSQYGLNDSLQAVDYNFLENHVVMTPNQFEQTIWNSNPNPMYQYHSGPTDFIYTRFLFGVIGGIGFKKIISGVVSLGVAANISYDFTNSEKQNFIAYPVLGKNEDGSRAKSHNIGYGLQFTSMYLFN